DADLDAGAGQIEAQAQRVVPQLRRADERHARRVRGVLEDEVVGGLDAGELADRLQLGGVDGDGGAVVGPLDAVDLGGADVRALEEGGELRLLRLDDLELGSHCGVGGGLGLQAGQLRALAQNRPVDHRGRHVGELDQHLDAAVRELGGGDRNLAGEVELVFLGERGGRRDGHEGRQDRRGEQEPIQSRAKRRRHAASRDWTDVHSYVNKTDDCDYAFSDGGNPTRKWHRRKASWRGVSLLKGGTSRLLE